MTNNSIYKATVEYFIENVYGNSWEDESKVYVAAKSMAEATQKIVDAYGDLVTIKLLERVIDGSCEPPVLSDNEIFTDKIGYLYDTTAIVIYSHNPEKNREIAKCFCMTAGSDVCVYENAVPESKVEMVRKYDPLYHVKRSIESAYFDNRNLIVFTDVKYATELELLKNTIHKVVLCYVDDRIVGNYTVGQPYTLNIDMLGDFIFEPSIEVKIDEDSSVIAEEIEKYLETGER